MRGMVGDRPQEPTCLHYRQNPFARNWLLDSCNWRAEPLVDRYIGEVTRSVKPLLR